MHDEILESLLHPGSDVWMDEIDDGQAGGCRGKRWHSETLKSLGHGDISAMRLLGWNFDGRVEVPGMRDSFFLMSSAMVVVLVHLEKIVLNAFRASGMPNVTSTN